MKKQRGPSLAKARLPELQPREMVIVRDAQHLHYWTIGDLALVLPPSWGTLVPVWRAVVRTITPRHALRAVGHDVH